MRRLLLTASVIALGLGGIGFANATDDTQGQAGQSGNPSPPAASATQSPTKATGMATQRPTRTTSQQTAATRMNRGEIIQAQRRLHADGLYRGRIDGKFNSQTRIALRHFQQQNHLPLTARLDNRTMSSLMGGTMGQGSSRPPKSTHARTMGKSLQNVNQQKSQPENTMGQGSSGGQPNATPVTPPNTQTPTGSENANPTPSTGHNNLK